LQRIGGTRVYKLGVVSPGNVRALDVKLAAWKYRLWCSLADHRARGMLATFDHQEAT